MSNKNLREYNKKIVLHPFFSEVHKKNGDKYKLNILRTVLAALDRHIK